MHGTITTKVQASTPAHSNVQSLSFFVFSLCCSPRPYNAPGSDLPPGAVLHRRRQCLPTGRRGRGEPGYEEFLEAIANPGHPEHDAMVEWHGEIFDPTLFDCDGAPLVL